MTTTVIPICDICGKKIPNGSFYYKIGVRLRDYIARLCSKGIGIGEFYLDGGKSIPCDTNSAYFTYTLCYDCFRNFLIKNIA